MTFQLGTVQIRIVSGTIIILAGCFLMNEWKLVLALFVAVLTHEFGHIGMANCLGIQVEAIDVMPTGGVIHVTSFYHLSIKDEIVLALAGPIANLFMALTCSLMLNLGLFMGEWVTLLMMLSFGMFLFNAFPALPLDGGRVLRAMLCKTLTVKKAANISAIMGYVLAVGICSYGIISLIQGEFNLLLFIIAYFLFMGAKEAQKNVAYVLMKNISQKDRYLSQSGAIETIHLTVREDVPIGKVIRNFGNKKLYKVYVANSQLDIVGVLDEKQIIEGATQYGSQKAINTLLRKQLAN